MMCFVKSLFKHAKRRFEENVAVNRKCYPKSFFRYVRNKKKKIQSLIGPLTDDSGNIVTDYQQIGNTLNHYFASVLNINYTDNVPLIHDDLSGNENPGHTLPEFDVTRDEIFKALQSLKANKSPGPHEIYPKLLKEITNEVLSPLTTLFNMSLR